MVSLPSFKEEGGYSAGERGLESGKRSNKDLEGGGG